jgi:parallel beta-helix repeat protein
MKWALPAFLAAVVAASLMTLLRPADGRESDPPTATVSFSQDERTATIGYGDKEWVLPRPVVSPWKYEPAGKTLWVSVDGDDMAAGTTDHPFRTISMALARTGPGDVIYLKAGIYTEDVLITKSGWEEKPIILSCAPGALGKVVVTPSADYVRKHPSGAVISVKGARSVWINGLVIEGPKGRPEAPKKETYGANGITWLNKDGKGCRATNNVIYGNLHCGLKEMDQHVGAGIFIEGNIIFDNGTDFHDHGIYMPADDVTINGNIIFESAGFGVHAYESPRRLTITRNVCFANKAGALVLAGSDCKVLNNTFADNLRGMFYFRSGCANNVVENNIFAFNRTDCDYDNGGGKLGDPHDNLDDYNCSFPGKPNPAVKSGPNEVTADPLFMDAKKRDYRLREKSPCLRAGTDVGLPHEGKKPNLGAY